MPYFEDLVVGSEITTLQKGPITRQHLVEWCAAENDYYHLHYDDRVAAKMGLPGPPIQGSLRYALLGQAIANWLGGNGRLVEIAATYKGLNLEGETLTVSGRVSELKSGLGEGTATIEMYVSGTGDRPSTIGKAVVALPYRNRN